MSSLRLNKRMLAEMISVIGVAFFCGFGSIGAGSYAASIFVMDGWIVIRIVAYAVSAVLIVAGVFALLFATEGMKVVVGEILPEIAILRRRIQEIESKRGDGPAIVKKED